MPAFVSLRTVVCHLNSRPCSVRDAVHLSTRIGPLDCLGTLIDGRGFEELVSHSESIVDEGAEFLVVDLPTLIEIKTKTGRAKDRLMLPVLIALAEQLEDSKGEAK